MWLSELGITAPSSSVLELTPGSVRFALENS
jgi:hypothetical protein